MRVVVYKNLNRGDWSVAELKGRVGYGRVIGHVQSIVLADVVFHWLPTAQQKVFRGAARTVHAWAIGEIIAEAIGPKTEVTYNPKRCGGFHTRDGRAVSAAPMVEFSSDGRSYAVCL